ncbi:chorismate-binding protein [Sanyastnella coralliicola]|uniref:chorismate-binding protein n=1 Tax=Sanyastnella coralliicola TaxID=3069118 RepID=UPI0027BA5BED|nr:chorismate-binding protein [Longitalea sp. SCSIO 12813]
MSEGTAPFVIWSPPHEDSFFTVDPTGTGGNFVFAPFHSSEKHIEFSGKKVAFDLADFHIPFQSLQAFRASETQELSHQRKIKKAIEQIIESDLDKVVLSTITFKADLKPSADWLQSLKKNHPNTFVYCLYHPEAGCWMGATPEILVSADGDRFKTMSLAGTRKYEDDTIPWGQKESLEQSIVTDYIKARLKEGGAEELRISRPETVRFGDLEHIRSELRFKTDDISRTLDLLHPTPAVCGTPLDTAYEAITALEDHDRKWYTGYLGWHDDQGDSYFYVNLRCFEVYSNGILGYTGGGITFDSLPNEEWDETRHKLNALLSPIEKL